MLAPAYDILSTHFYLGTQGHALALLQEGGKVRHDSREPLLTPQSLLKFTNALEIPLKEASHAVREVARKAARAWLDPIQQA